MASRVFKDAIARQLSRITGIKEAVIGSAIEIPKSRTHGEFAIPLPKLSAMTGKSQGSPVQWAGQLATKVNANDMSKTTLYSTQTRFYLITSLRETHL